MRLSNVKFSIDFDYYFSGESALLLIPLISNIHNLIIYNINITRYNSMHVNSANINRFKLPSQSQINQIPISSKTKTFESIVKFNFSLNYNNILNDHSLLSYFKYPSSSTRIDLNKNFDLNENFSQSATSFSHLDNFINYLIDRDFNFNDYNYVTYRGILTKLSTLFYNYDEDFKFNCTLINDTIFVSDNSPLASPSNHFHKLSMYHGYAFEYYCTNDNDDVRVNTNEQYININDVTLSDKKVLIAGEVDCINDNNEYVELKTSKVITNRHDQNIFDKKLLKFYFQSYLLNISKIIVGFKDKKGFIDDIKEFNTLDLPNLVKGKTFEWNPDVCLSLTSMLLDFISYNIKSHTKYVNKPNLTYQLNYVASNRSLEINLIDNKDILKDDNDTIERIGFIPLKFFNHFNIPH